MEKPDNTWWNTPEEIPDEVVTPDSIADDDSPMPESKTSSKALRPKNNKLPIIGSVFLVLALAGGLVAANFTKPNPYEPKDGQYQSIEHPATIPAIINECGSIFQFTPDSKYYGQFPEEFFDDPTTGKRVKRQTYYHPMIVPAYGFMANKPLDNPPSYISPDETKIPKMEDVLRLMWDGWTIIWYVPPGSASVNIDDKTFNATLTLGTLESIKDYADTHEKTLALPWMGEKPLPSKRNLAFSQWGVTQSCKVWNPEIVDSFNKKADELSPARPIIPPYAPLAPNGELYPIDVKFGS